jgi:F-type H+-transporting ATPase subunit b
MNINATLFVQALSFAFLIWFAVKFIWPPLNRAIDERNKRIADGLAAAEKGKASLVEAQAKYPNIKVYNWTQVVQDAWFSSDRIHYTGEGYTERARLIADALAATYPA